MNYPYSAANDGTATLLKSGLSDLFWLHVENDDASIRYLRLFDAATAEAVDLATTSHAHVFRIPASGSFEWRPGVRLPFSRGIVAAVVTTRDGATAVTAPAYINARLG